MPLNLNASESPVELLSSDSIIAAENSNVSVLEDTNTFTCPNRVACSGCQAIVFRDLLPDQFFEHHRASADCNKCNGHVQKTKLQSFYSRTLRQIVLCNWCGSSVKWVDIERHKSLECPKAEVTCPRGCGASSLLKEDLPMHYFQCLKVSPNKTFPCPNGCNGLVQKQHFQAHVNCLCPKSTIVCPRKCKTLILRESLQKHCCPIDEEEH